MSFFSNLLFSIFILIVTDCKLEFKLSFIPNFKCSVDLFPILHWTKVNVLQWSDRVLAEHGIHIHIDRNRIVGFLGFAFKNVQHNVGCVFSGSKFDFFLGHEFHDDILLFIRLEFSFHWFYCEDFSGLFLLHVEVILHRVHSNVFEVQLVLLRFTHSDSFKVQNLIVAEFHI